MKENPENPDKQIDRQCQIERMPQTKWTGLQCFKVADRMIQPRFKVKCQSQEKEKPCKNDKFPSKLLHERITSILSSSTANTSV